MIKQCQKIGKYLPAVLIFFCLLNLDVVADKIDINKIKVINYTRWYPGWVYSARRDLNPVIVKKIKKALLSLNFEDSRDRIILEKADIRAIIPSEDSDFDSIRRLFAKIGGSFCE